MEIELYLVKHLKKKKKTVLLEVTSLRKVYKNVPKEKIAVQV